MLPLIPNTGLLLAIAIFPQSYAVRPDLTLQFEFESAEVDVGESIPIYDLIPISTCGQNYPPHASCALELQYKSTTSTMRTPALHESALLYLAITESYTHNSLPATAWREEVIFRRPAYPLELPDNPVDMQTINRRSDMLLAAELVLDGLTPNARYPRNIQGDASSTPLVGTSPQESFHYKIQLHCKILLPQKWREFVGVCAPSHQSTFMRPSCIHYHMFSLSFLLVSLREIQNQIRRMTFAT